VTKLAVLLLVIQVPTVDLDRARVGPFERHRHAEDGGLARPARADDDDLLAGATSMSSSRSTTLSPNAFVTPRIRTIVSEVGPQAASYPYFLSKNWTNRAAGTLTARNIRPAIVIVSTYWNVWEPIERAMNSTPARRSTTRAGRP
jgi:hypothetical protein